MQGVKTKGTITHSEASFGDDRGRAAGGALARAGLWAHKMPQRPRRLRLLVVMVRLLAICETLAARSSFLINRPASPLSVSKSCSRLVSITVEVSMFFTASLISAVFVVRTLLNSVAKWLISSENSLRLLTAISIAGLLDWTSELTLSTVVSAWSETLRKLPTVVARFVSVWSLSTRRRTSAMAAL